MATLVRTSKLSAVGGGAPAASWDEFTPRQHPPTGCSLPVDYTIDGFLIEPLGPGRPMQMLRLVREGMPAVGLFTYTRVLEIRVKTENSEYLLIGTPAHLAEQ